MTRQPLFADGADDATQAAKSCFKSASLGSRRATRLA